MSRPAITTGPFSAMPRCARTIAARTSGCAATTETIAVTSLLERVASSSSRPPAMMRKPSVRRFVELDFDRLEAHEPRERGTVIDIGSGSQRKRGKCAIHRTGVEIEYAEALRRRSRNGRLSRGSRSVDRDLQIRWSAHPRRVRPGKAAAPQNFATPGGLCRLVAKTRAVYFCSACGFESPRWLGRCPQCEAWNSFDERPFTVATRARSARQSAATDAGPIALHEIGSAGVARVRIGMPEFDAVLGGGIVPGSLTLVGGPPGAGKSTLLLQIAARLAQQGEVVYVCGEESAAQVKLRAERILGGLAFDQLRMTIFPETNLRAVLDRLERRPPLAMVVDSIQTVWLPESEAYAGSVTQIRDCTQALMEYAKRTGCAEFYRRPRHQRRRDRGAAAARASRRHGPLLRGRGERRAPHPASL